MSGRRSVLENVDENRNFASENARKTNKRIKLESGYNAKVQKHRLH